MLPMLTLLAFLAIPICDSAVYNYEPRLTVQMHQNKDISGFDHLGNLKRLSAQQKEDPQPNQSNGEYMKRKLELANANLLIHREEDYPLKNLKDAPLVELSPGQPAKPFSVPTLGGNLVYPGPVINPTVPVLFHAYNPLSGFGQCLWNCSGSIEALVEKSPADTHYVFMSTSMDAYDDALWMHNQFKAAITLMLKGERIALAQAESLESRLHFVTLPVSELGNWIPLALHQWMCLDHNCGLDQIRVNSTRIQESLHRPLVVPRLDARYDWLPSASSVFGNKSLVAIFVGDGCHGSETAKDKVAIVTDGGCTFFDKVQAMQQSGSVGIIVMSSSSVQDMNCVDQECQTPLNIPASSIVYNELMKSSDDITVQFQTTPTDNFFLAIDGEGKLAQTGWFLFPSMSFLVYQAQWFEYKRTLEQRLSKATTVITLLADVPMHGSPGAEVTMSLPPMEELAKYSRLELDLSLSCPGTDDETCPHWDHTVQLMVSQRKATVSWELGRWITPFRRRVGRWLSEVSPLLPLLDPTFTTFTLHTAPWAMTWMPSLNLRLSGKRNPGDLYPYKAEVLYSGDSFTFDKNYNSLFKPLKHFNPPKDAKKVELYSVITGHGSDENGCGEFCVTSHHYDVNGQQHSITFGTAGTPLGCAENVPNGVTPNEHGTWLYGRDGWCDGQDVRPWVVDITADLRPGSNNTISYHGYFNGTDPDPKHNPGIMIVHSYLVFYKPL